MSTITHVTVYGSAVPVLSLPTLYRLHPHPRDLSTDRSAGWRVRERPSGPSGVKKRLGLPGPAAIWM
eukprot:5515502-Lingulodinium_polyedra.AAC.1